MLLRILLVMQRRYFFNALLVLPLRLRDSNHETVCEKSSSVSRRCRPDFFWNKLDKQKLPRKYLQHFNPCHILAMQCPAATIISKNTIRPEIAYQHHTWHNTRNCPNLTAKKPISLFQNFKTIPRSAPQSAYQAAEFYPAVHLSSP